MPTHAPPVDARAEIPGTASGGGGLAPPYDGVARMDPRGEFILGPSGPFGLQVTDKKKLNGTTNPYRETTSRQQVDPVKRAVDYFASERGLSAHRIYDVSEYLLWRNRVVQEETDAQKKAREQYVIEDEKAAATLPAVPSGAPVTEEPSTEITRSPYFSMLKDGDSQQETHPWDFICTWAPTMAGPMRSAWNHWMADRVYADENDFLKDKERWHLWISLACVKHSQMCATAGSGGNVMSRSALTLSHLKNSRDIDRVLAKLGSANIGIDSGNSFY